MNNQRINVKRNLRKQHRIEVDSQRLRESLEEEAQFIQRHIDNQKCFEIPHPSDIFVQTKHHSSCPSDLLGVDFLILVHFISFYFRVRKEKIFQLNDTIEQIILNVLK